MIKINEYNSKKGNDYTNAILTEHTMLVGTHGKRIDVNKSYEKMKKVNGFNERLLEYEDIKPVINKSNNLDKLIIGKKTSNKVITFVFKIDNLDQLEQVVYILNKNDSSATFFIDGKVIENNILELTNYFKNNIDFGYYTYNNKYDSLSLKYVKGLLENNNFKKSNYCLYKNSTFLKTCINNRVNTIGPVKINSKLYNYIKYKKENGLIYQIDPNDYNIKELNSTIIYLNQKGYTLLSLKELLKE